MIIVVIGGGTAAIAATKHLLHTVKNVEVYIVSPREFYEYTPGILRCMVEPSHFSACMVTLREIFRGTDKVKIVTDAVVELGTDKVKLSSGRELNFDLCVVASGAGYENPIHASETTVVGRIQELEEWKRKLVLAERVLIIGGGITGVELTAEIVCTFQMKHVTIVNSAPHLLGEMSAKAGEIAERFLSKRGVKVMNGVRAEKKSETSFEIKSRETGDVLETIDADMHVFCLGGKPNSSFLDKTLLDSRGRLQVNPDLTVEGSNGKIFAAGDVASRSGQHAMYAELMGQLVAKNISRTIRAVPNLKYPENCFLGLPFEADATLVSLGKHNGIMKLGPIFLSGPLAGISKQITEWSFMTSVRGSKLQFIYTMLLGSLITVVRVLYQFGLR